MSEGGWGGSSRNPHMHQSAKDGRLGWSLGGIDVQERKLEFFVAGEKLSLETQR